MSKQKTLQDNVKISGVGLHTGEEVHLTLHPAPENHGITFKRVDNLIPEQNLVLSRLSAQKDVAE